MPGESTHSQVVAVFKTQSSRKLLRIGVGNNIALYLTRLQQPILQLELQHRRQHRPERHRVLLRPHRRVYFLRVTRPQRQRHRRPMLQHRLPQRLQHRLQQPLQRQDDRGAFATNRVRRRRERFPRRRHRRQQWLRHRDCICCNIASRLQRCPGICDHLCLLSRSMSDSNLYSSMQLLFRILYHMHVLSGCSSSKYPCDSVF